MTMALLPVAEALARLLDDDAHLKVRTQETAP